MAIHLKSREIQRCVSGPHFMQPRLAKRDCLSGPGREQLQQWFVAQDKLFERCLVCSQNSRRRLLDRSLAVHPCFLLLVSGSDQTPAHRPLAHFLRGTPACYCCLDRDFFIILPFCLCLALQEPRVSEARQVCAEAPVFPGSNIIRLCVRGVPQLASEPASLSTRGVNSGARDMGSLACVDRNVQFPKISPLILWFPLGLWPVDSNQSIVVATRDRTRT